MATAANTTRCSSHRGIVRLSQRRPVGTPFSSFQRSTASRRSWCNAEEDKKIQGAVIDVEVAGFAETLDTPSESAPMIPFG
jgi:hypothetical protein